MMCTEDRLTRCSGGGLDSGESSAELSTLVLEEEGDSRIVERLTRVAELPALPSDGLGGVGKVALDSTPIGKELGIIHQQVVGNIVRRGTGRELQCGGVRNGLRREPRCGGLRLWFWRGAGRGLRWGGLGHGL